MSDQQREGMSERFPDSAPAPADTAAPGIGLQRYLATLKAEWRLVALVVIIAITCGVVVAKLSGKQYEATAQVLVDQQGPVSAYLRTETASSDPERDLNTNVELIRVQPVAAAVRRRLGVTTSPADLLASVAVAPDSNSKIVSITARSSNPAMAALIANAFADEYQAFRARTARASVTAALASAHQQLDDLGPGGDGTTLGVRLARQINDLQTVGAFQTGGVQVIRHAGVPGAPAGHGAAFSGVLGAVLGLLLAATGVAVLARVDRRVREPTDVERVLGVPVLARAGRRHRSAGSHSRSPAAAEPYSGLAARLAFSPLRRRSDVLLVTATDPEAPTPEVALGLALALRRLGRDVILIEADLRAPRLAGAGDDESPGLTDILTGAAVRDSQLATLPRAPGDDAGEGEVRVLPAGRYPTSPEALLASDDMASLVRAARARWAVVLLVAAPLTRPGAVLPLARLARGALLVVSRERTTEQALSEALDDLDGTLIGAVLADPPARADRVGGSMRRSSRARSRAASREDAKHVAGSAAPYPTSEVTQP